MNRRLYLFALALTLAGCGAEKPAVQSTEPFHIAEVQAVGPLPSGTSEWQLEDLRRETASLATLVPETGNPRLLQLRILGFHKKSPGMSFIVGDSNWIDVSGVVMSLDGGQSLGSFTAHVSTDAYVNGIIGATVAATESNTDAARELNDKAASAILEKIYGTRAWNAWANRRR